MKRIVQKSFQQMGVVITDTGRIIPYFIGEDPFTIAAKALVDSDVKVEYVFSCFDPIKFGQDYRVGLSEEFMTCLRTGFAGVSQYGYNKYVDKGLYA